MTVDSKGRVKEFHKLTKKKIKKTFFVKKYTSKFCMKIIFTNVIAKKKKKILRRKVITFDHTF